MSLVDIAGHPGLADLHSLALATITPTDLHREALDGEEIAVVDVREGDRYASGHISIAVELPLSEIELRVDALLPRRTVRLVITDDDGQAAQEAGRRLQALGYSDIRILGGGLEAWKNAGFELITGEFSLSKALGEFVERRYHTPRISAKELHAKIESGEELVILDTRPVEEFNHIAIPGGIAAPGAELLYRVFDAVKSPTTPIVVNCAGRTRAIIGAQALLNAGVSNPIVSLENGTSAWLLDGFEPASGADALAAKPSQEGLAKAREAAAAVAERFGGHTIDAAGLEKFRAERNEHTLYLYDVRTPEEFEAGHFPGSRSAPGGQLVQTTDRFIGTRQGRVVLIDEPDLVRSRITASWLYQLGLENVYVYAASMAELTERGPVATQVPGLQEEVETLSPKAVRELLERGQAIVVDLDPVQPYYRERRYIPGSLVGRRSTLSRTLGLPRDSGTIVLTSSDGLLARLAAADLSQSARKVVALDGGTQAWLAAGYPTNSGLDQPAIDPSEALPQLPTLEQRRVRLDAYVRWGDEIVNQLERDGLVKFRPALA